MLELKIVFMGDLDILDGCQLHFHPGFPPPLPFSLAARAFKMQRRREGNEDGAGRAGAEERSSFLRHLSHLHGSTRKGGGNDCLPLPSRSVLMTVGKC